MNKVVILASGGLDSSVLVALYSHLNYDVHVLSFDYGQKNYSQESNKLNNLVGELEIPSMNLHHVKINIPWTKSSIVESYQNTEGVYVEMRNLIFLSYAVSLSEAIGAEKIVVGYIKVPVPYSDTSEGFLSDMDALSMRALGIKVEAPLINMTKEEVYLLGRKFGVGLKSTFSCNTPVNGKLCGKCGDCKDLIELINKEVVDDVDNPFI